MFRFKRIHNESGFSLVELMIVVGIIGILSTLVVTRMKSFDRKAKMAEVRNTISYMYTLEKSYQLDSNQFIAMAPMGAGKDSLTGNNSCEFAKDPGAAALGFAVDPCTTEGPLPRYSYQVTGATGSEFVASGITGSLANNRICPGNAQHWIGVNERNRVYGATNANPTNSDTLHDLTAGVACPN